MIVGRRYRRCSSRPWRKGAACGSASPATRATPQGHRRGGSRPRAHRRPQVHVADSPWMSKAGTLHLTSPADYSVKRLNCARVEPVLTDKHAGPTPSPQGRTAGSTPPPAASRTPTGSSRPHAQGLRVGCPAASSEFATRVVVRRPAHVNHAGEGCVERVADRRSWIHPAVNERRGERRVGDSRLGE